MIITHKITMDLADPKSMPTINTVQNDQYTRDLEITLLCGGAAWKPPDGTTVVVRYCKSDKCGGEYDTMPDGTAAWSISGNVLTVALAPQVLTVAGPVRVNVGLIHGTTEISTFQILIHVHQNVGAELADSEDYWRRSGLLPSPAPAETGQYIRVQETDGLGVVLSTVAADPVHGDLSQNDETAEDYVKGRTHWKEIGQVPLDIVWDGEIGDRISATANGMTFVKVSDLILSNEELLDCILRQEHITDDSMADHKLADMGELELYIFGDSVIHSHGVGIARNTADNFGTEEMPAYAPETGIYFWLGTNAFVSRLYSDTVTMPAEVYHTLPVEFLPERSLLPEVTAADARKVLAVSDQGRWTAAFNPGIILLTQGEYDNLAASGAIADDVLYIIEG